MRIVFDTSPAPFTPGGTRTYIENLVQELPSLSAKRGISLGISRLPAWLKPNSSKGMLHKLKVAAWDSYYMHLLLPARARSVGADLLHTSAIRIPLRAKMPIVTTIHDVIPFLFPEFFRLRDRVVLGRYLYLTSWRAAHIITGSEHSRQDIHRLLHVPLSRITVTPYGISPNFRPASEAEVAETLARYGIAKPYILSVGTLEPRKNLLRVLTMFAALRNHHPIPHHLVLVGRRGWLERPILEEIEQAAIREAIHITGYVAERDLPALYSGASVFVYPSFYEGFGLPPLQAMACGCPVVSSTVSSLPEVVGDAGLLVDPEDTNAIRDAVLRILTEPSFAETLRERGLERAGTFTWRRCAEETLDVYQKTQKALAL